ncbi:chromosome segregation protein [Bacillus toyonensis]|uniref:chromosome segregation protein n=1 Tax=Bacillus toyonensis TaxID=155322 RepID=UPI0020D26768|nr:chromosome segregation protein [Bacillus toyonensis]
MSKDKLVEGWDKAIKGGYGSKETDSLMVETKGSTFVKTGDKELPTIQDYNKAVLISEEQSKRLEIQLVKVEAEKVLIENELKDKLKSAQRKIESLHTRVENGDEIFESDGLQSLGVDIDTLKSRLVSYNQFIIYLKSMGNLDN